MDVIANAPFNMNLFMHWDFIMNIPDLTGINMLPSIGTISITLTVDNLFDKKLH